MPTLNGKTALVTGASRGIGRAVAARLAADGAELILHCNRNRHLLEDLAKELPAPPIMIQANLGDAGDIQRMFSSLKRQRLDILVHNAGIWKSTPLGHTSPEVLDELLAVNLKSLFMITQLALPLLRDGARIVIISSTAAHAAVVGRSVYGATKAAAESFARNWALELAPRKILVNAVEPGYVETDMTANHLSDPETRDRALSRHPLGRMGTTEDIAKVVAFLCSEDAGFITGQSINASGGFVI